MLSWKRCDQFFEEFSDLQEMVQTLEQVCQARGCERGHPIPDGRAGNAAGYRWARPVAWQPVVEPRVAPRSGRNNAAPGRRKARRGSKLGHL